MEASVLGCRRYDQHVITLLAGVLVCFAGLKSGIFHWKPPVWLTEEGLGKIAAKGILLLMDEGAREYHVLADNAHESGSALRDKLYSIVKSLTGTEAVP